MPVGAFAAASNEIMQDIRHQRGPFTRLGTLSGNPSGNGSWINAMLTALKGGRRNCILDWIKKAEAITRGHGRNDYLGDKELPHQINRFGSMIVAPLHRRRQLYDFATAAARR